MDTVKQRRFRWLLVVAAAIAWLALTVDNWSRDFVRYDAAISAHAQDPTLRPLESPRPTGQLVEAVKMAARRIKNWRFAGEAEDGETALIYFERTQRLLGFKDDIIVRIEDRGNRRAITAESRSRLRIGDLGRNPRNLRRLLAELRLVLDGAAPGPILELSIGAEG